MLIIRNLKQSLLKQVTVKSVKPSIHLSQPSHSNCGILNCGLEKTLERPLDCKEIQPVHSEEDRSWDFFGRTDAKAETLIL